MMNLIKSHLRRNQPQPNVEDDLYTGYNDYPVNMPSTEDLVDYEVGLTGSRHTTGLTSARGRTSVSASFLGSRLGTSAGFTRQPTARSGLITRSGTARPHTGMMTDDGSNRPMTAVRGAGYTGKKSNLFDKGQGGPSIMLDPKQEDTPEEKCKVLENKINDIVEESMKAGFKGDRKKGLELAKEAANKEKSLMRLKEQAGIKEGHDWDITFSVLFNLACQYEACEMYTEALSTYHSITKNKFLVHGPKIKINMGNIYLKQNNPTKAIKMYRMAMDQLNNTNKDLRLKLMHNMGIVFLRIGLFDDASDSFEYIMQEKPDFKTGLHLVVANCLAVNPEKMKRSFEDLLEVPNDFEEDEEKYSTISDDPVSQLLLQVLKNDRLRKLEKDKRLYAERCILSCARLIAPHIELTLSDGYNWVSEAIKSSRHSYLAHALEISKAIVFLKQRELGNAIEILKSFEKKESKVATAAATNLSFLFFLQGDIEQAEKYGEVAKNADFYNSSAYVNLGNCKYAKEEWDKAKKCYMEAIESDSSCIEALFNLGMTNQNLKFYEEALECFHKVQSLVKNHPHVTYQIGKTHELMGENELAGEWMLKTLALTPTDPGILKKLGTLAELDGDKSMAYQYFYDCYRLDNADLEVIEWLASYLKEMQVPDKAIGFYQKASLQQPDEARWVLLIANCYLRAGNYSQALETFTRVYKENPDNLQALQGLARLSSDMGLKEAEKYNEELRKLERLSNERYMSARGSGARSHNSRGGVGGSVSNLMRGDLREIREREMIRGDSGFAYGSSTDEDRLSDFGGSRMNLQQSSSMDLRGMDSGEELENLGGAGGGGMFQNPGQSGVHSDQRRSSSGSLGGGGGKKRPETPAEELDDFWSQGENELAEQNPDEFLPF